MSLCRVCGWEMEIPLRSPWTLGCTGRMTCCGSSQLMHGVGLSSVLCLAFMAVTSLSSEAHISVCVEVEREWPAQDHETCRLLWRNVLSCWTGGARPAGTPSVKRTLTTEFLVEVEDERAEMLYMCQETARKILNPIESDEMNMKRIVCCIEEGPDREVPVDTFPESERAHGQRLGRSTTDLQEQEQERRNRAMGNATLSAWSRTQQSVRLSLAEAELHVLTTGVAEGMASKCLSRASLDTR